MKKPFLLLALVTLLLQAVKVEAQVGFHAGYAPQTLSVSGQTVMGDAMPSTHFQGFFGGIHFDYPILDNLTLIPALQIRLNTANSKSQDCNIEDWQFIADLPLQVSYCFPLGDDLGMGIFAGPMLSYGISYTQKTTDMETFEVITSIDRYNTDFQVSSLRRFEVNVDGGLFLKYKDFMLYSGYRMGLNDLDAVDSMTTKARGFFVGIGMD